MPSWNGVPIPEAPQIKIPNSLPQNFNWNSYLSDPKGTFNKFKGAREVNRINWKGYRTASATAKKVILSSPSKKFISDAAKQIKALAESSKESKGLWDKFLDKAGGSGDAANKAANAGGVVAKGGAALIKLAPIITAIAAVGIALVVNEIQGWRADINEKGLIQLGQDVSKVLGILKTYKDRIEDNKKAIAESKIADQRTRDRILSIEKEQPKIQKQSNDALYETRQGRTILEGKIVEAKKQSNDALYETRQGRTILEGKISGLGTSFDAKIQSINAQISKFNNNVLDAFQKSVNSTISKIQSDLALTKAQIGAIKPATPVDTASITANAVSAARAIVTPLQAAIGTLSGQTIVALQESQTTRAYVDRVLVPRIEATVTQSTGVTAEMAKLKGEAQNTRAYVDRVLVPRIEATVTQSTGVKAEVEGIKQQIPTLSAEIKQSQTRISEVDTKIREQEKVNALALPKLDQILGILPLIPARAANAIRPDIATIPQIEAAAAAGTCRTTQPGGCMSKALDNNAANITNNANTNTGNILGAVNAVGQGADLALLGVINNKLGNQLPGGIGGKLSRFAEWAHLDRALNIMNFAANLHNAAMLSNNLGQTLLSVIGNILSVVGLKDAEGQDFDIGSVINKGIENLMKGAIGEENYKVLNDNWKKANRIYQAAANLLNSIQSLSSSILSALEVVGQWNAKVANALKKFGVVGEKAYTWMNPNVNFQNKHFTALENATNVISQVDQVASEVLSIKETVGQIVEQKKELDNSLKEDGNSKQKTDLPEAAKVKEKEDKAKLDSAALPLAENDKEADED